MRCCTGTDITYRSPKKLGACVIQQNNAATTQHRHCNCLWKTSNIHNFNECKMYCDNDISCKGFTTTKTEDEGVACQLATTSICPSTCTTIGDLTGTLILDGVGSAESATGCYIKTAGN